MSNARYPRALLPVLNEDLGLYPVVAVMGARQVGKSTLCREIADARGLASRTLDDSDVLDQAREDPEGLLDDLGDGGAFIDEVQRAPGLLLAIKAIVDREQRPGRYLLSGSNQPKISSEVGDSLLGRAAYRQMRPLTLSELRFDEAHPGWDFLFEEGDAEVIRALEGRASASGPLDWRTVVQIGGFPRALAAPAAQQRRILDDYIDVFASRDIRDVLAVESSARFEQFLRLLAARTGQELNAQGLSRDLGTPVNTIRRWIDALGRSYLVELVPPYSRNAGQRVIKAPKLFMADAGLALAAAREADPTGFHLETLVATDLGVWKDGAAGRHVHHWRLASGQEVDFVLELNGKLVPLEVKASTSVGASEMRHLDTFRMRHGSAVRCLLLSCDTQIRALKPRVIAAPWWAVL
jgi:predicted AAA+ superfamily ATPase